MSTMRQGSGSNMDGVNEDDWIEAEIQRELDALSPLDGSALSVGTEEEDDAIDRTSDEEEPPPNGTIPESVAQYLETVKNRAQDAQQTIKECSDLLESSHMATDEDDVQNFAYQSKELNELAFQLGEDPEELRDRVIHELEEADRKDLEGYQVTGSEVEVNGLDLVPVLDEESGAVMVYTDINKFEKDLMEKVQALESMLQEREEIEMREREEAGRTMAMLDRNAEQLRQRKQQENDEEQRKMAQERMVTQARIEEEIAEENRQAAEQLQQYQHQIDELARQTALEKESFEREHQQEIERQANKKQNAATTIQAAFRSYRVRKPYKKKMRLIQEGLKEKRENERQMEIVIARKRKEEQKRKEKLEKMKKEEEERKKREEEEKRKEDERLEVERLERMRLKKEKKEKERKEKERLKREEEKAKKQEELRKESEEILKRILPDRQKDQQNAIKGSSEAQDGKMQEVPGKEPEGTHNASAMQENTLSDGRMSSTTLSKGRSVSPGETVFITEKDVSFVRESCTDVAGSPASIVDVVKGHQNFGEIRDRTIQEVETGQASLNQLESQESKSCEDSNIRSSKSTDPQPIPMSLSAKSSGGSATTHPDLLVDSGLRVSGKEIKSSIVAVPDQRETKRSKLPQNICSGQEMQSPLKGGEDQSDNNRSKITKGIASKQTLPVSENTKQNTSQSAGQTFETEGQFIAQEQSMPKDSTLKEEATIQQRQVPSSEESHQERRIKCDEELPSKESSQGDAQNLMEHRPLEAELEQRRLKWIQDCISLTKLASKAKLESTSNKPRRTLRRPASAKKVQALSEEQIKAASPAGTPLDQVTTVQLKDLPGSSLTSLLKCQRLRTLTLNNCGVTALESLDESPDVLWVDVSHNKIESMLCRDRKNLVGLDASWNALTSLQGLEGCSRLRRLNLCNNKITRISGVETLISLTHLDLSHNQLVNVSGLSSLVHLQDLNLTANHLSSVRGLDQCPLLQKLDLSSNSLSQVPCLANNILLRSLSLAGNSLSSLGNFTLSWLPLLQHLDLSQNGLSELPHLKSFLLLNHLSICNNFLSDVDCIIEGLTGCAQLKHLDVQGNAFTEEPQYRDAIIKVLPGLEQLDSDLLTSRVKGHDPTLTPSSFEVMCRSQLDSQDALQKRHEAEISMLKDQGDLKFGVARTEMLSRQLEERFQQAVEHRYAHEYGETSPTTAADIKPGAVDANENESIPNIATSPDRKRSTNNTKNIDETVIATGKMAVISGLSDEKTNEKANEKHRQGDRSKLEAHGKGGFKGHGSYEHSRRMEEQTKTQDLQRRLEPDGISLSDRAATVIQAQWRGFSVRRSIEVGTKQWLAALKIQTYWRGHRVRCWMAEVKRSLKSEVDKAVYEDEAEFAEIDLDSFDFDESMLDKGLTTPSETPTLLPKYPPLPPTSSSTQARPHPPTAMPPSHQPSPYKPYPPSTTKPSSPEKPQGRPLRQAWRGVDSPIGHNPQGRNLPAGGVSPPDGLGGLVMTKPPLPPTTPSSLGGTEVLSMGTPRTHRSARQEQLTEEWGFKDSLTADLMMKRAKKLAKGKKKKLDPIQRYQQIRKNQDAHASRPVQAASKKGVQRKDYFQARDEEAERKLRAKAEESSHKQHRTFDWVHAQVNKDLQKDLQASEPNINQYGMRSRQSNSEPNLPAMSPDIIQGSRVNLVMSPNAMEVQSVESVSIQGDFTSRERRHSFSSPHEERVNFPPIKTNSAPSSHTKQRMAAQGGDRRSGAGMTWGSAGSRTGRGKLSR